MSWQTTIAALKSSGETDSSLYDLFVRAQNGDPSALAKMERMHDENSDYMPIGATTAEDKIGDISGALRNYFGSSAKNDDEVNLPFNQIPPTSPSPDGGVKPAKSSMVEDLVRFAQNPEGKEILKEIAATLGGLFKADSPKGENGSGMTSTTEDEMWQCSCGYAENTRKFCAECGKPKPTPKPKKQTWKCECGYAENTRNFCAECGKPKPKEETWQCEDCGTTNARKFCPVCGKARPE